jgi:hypothetical protein
MNRAESESLRGWYQAVAIEPALHELEASVRELHLDADDPAYWPARAAWEKQLGKLVGLDAKKQELQRSAAYDVCHDFLLAVCEGRA